MEFENGNRIIAASMNGCSMRGRAFSEVFVDEAAFTSEAQYNEFWSNIVPTLSSARMMMLSTPNGKNHFYRTYVKIEEMKWDTWFAFRSDSHALPPSRKEILWKLKKSAMNDAYYRQECEAEFIEK